MKVMMIQLPHFYSATSRPATLYPIGIGYLASILRKNHVLVPLDLWIDNVSVDKAMKLIDNNVPDIFCISTYSTQYAYLKEFVKRLKVKYPNIKIIAGGPGATFSYSVFLRDNPIDFCVIGEGEITLPELLDNIGHAVDVEGIAYIDKGEIVRTKERKQIADIDHLPFPDRDFFNFKKYLKNSKAERGLFKGLRSTNIIAGRGCPYKCTYCSKTFSGIRLRSVSKIEEEIKYLISKYDLEAIEFNDELVVVNKKRILEICECLKKLGIKWGCQGRINLVDEEILKAMKDSGCMYIGYGVESFDQGILDRMKKQIKVDQIIPVIEMTRKIGINPIIQYMYGFPGENEVTIKKTIEFFKRINHSYVGFITTPLPGTELYENAICRGLIKDEESYLIQLDSGYNRGEPIINMTEFSSEELVRKRYQLIKSINGNYYRKHPLIYLKYLIRKNFGIIALLRKNPAGFFMKIKARLITHQNAT